MSWLHRMVPQWSDTHEASPREGARRWLPRLGAAALSSAVTATDLIGAPGLVDPAAASASTYANAVLADSPNAYWRLGEPAGSTTVVDSSGHGWTGTISGTETLGAAGALMNDPDTAMLSPGAGDVQTQYVQSSVTAYSEELWLKSTQTDPHVMLLEDRGNPPTGLSLTIWLGQNGGNTTGTGLLTFEMDTNNIDIGQTTVAPYNDGLWHHVVGTWSAPAGTAIAPSQFTIYVDGQLVPTYADNNNYCGCPTPTSPLSGNGGTVFGGYPGQTAFKGTLDEVAIYPAALSASQVAALQQASGNPVGGSLTAAEGFGGGGGAEPCAGGSQHTRAAPVNTASGNFWHTFEDLSIPGRGLPLQFGHTYNAQAAATKGPLGYGWTHSYAMSLSIGSGNSPVTVSQENGAQVTFTLINGSYNAPPRVVATLAHNGDGTWTLRRQSRETFSFNASGQLTREADLDGYATTLAYNASGQLTTVTDPAGRTLTLADNPAGLLASVTDTASPPRVVSFAYDASGNLTQVTDVGGGVTTFTYDGGHRLLTMLDPNQQSLPSASQHPLTNVYDTSNRVTSQTDYLGRTTTFDYSAVPGSTKVTDAKGNVTLDTYTSAELTAQTRGYGTSQAATWTYAYSPSCLGVTSVTDPEGHTATITYDASADVVSRTDALGRTTTSTYNSFREPLTHTDPRGVTTSLTYDGSGNLTQVSTPVCASPPCGASAPTRTTTYTYGDNLHPGDITSRTDPDRKVWTLTYDAYGDPASATDPLGNTRIACYDGVGRRTESVAPRGASGFACPTAPPAAPTPYTTLYTTNAFGDLVSRTDPLSHRVLLSYDAERNLTTLTDPNGNLTTYGYDADNELTQVKRADSPQTTLVTDYNADGTVADQKDGKGDTVASYGYDPLARLTSATDALGEATTYGYHPAGNLISRQDPGGNCAAAPKTGCTSYAYDADAEVISVIYSDGVTPNVSAITYGADGRRTALTDGTGTSTWSWDSLGRLIAYTNGSGAQLQWAYNLRGLPTTITYPGAHALGRAYDDAGRLASVSDWAHPADTTSFGYDADSNLTTETFPGGVVDSFSFNGADQMAAIADLEGSATVFSATYARDADGQLASDTSAPPAAASYHYTALNQLCYAGPANSTPCSAAPTGATAYAYDAADNLVTDGAATQAFNPADELCWSTLGASSSPCGSPPAGATTYTYDARGNRRAVAPAGGGQIVLGYDQAKRLMSWAGPTVATYAYDGQGLRMTKTVAGLRTENVNPIWPHRARLIWLHPTRMTRWTPQCLVRPGWVRFL